MPRPTFLAAVALAVGLAVGAAGALLIADRPGLRTEYFALTPAWAGSPVYVEVTAPGIAERADVAHVLVQQEIFSVRWRGWLDVAEAGTYRLLLAADETSYVALDGEPVLATEAATGRRRDRARLELERGPHAIEIGFSQTSGPAAIEVHWEPPGGDLAALPVDDLFAGRPIWPRRLARHVLDGPAELERRAVGTVLVLAALLLVTAAARALRVPLPSRESFTRSWARASPAVRRWLTTGVLAVLVIAAWAATFPYTTATVDGDDAAYMEAAAFGQRQAFIANRYVHVYLTKVLAWLGGGDVFFGSRALWSLSLAVVVVALALAAMASGPALQLKTFAVALFLLLSQPSLLGNIGASFSDYTAMMFITLGVAVYLLMRRSPAPASGREWHALAIGALTVAAFRSKETGIILAWLPVLFLWTRGRLDLPRFARRIGSWLLGVAAAWALLMAVDWIVLGDLLFSVRPGTHAEVGGAVFKAAPEQARTPWGWLHILWSGRGGQPDLALRYAGLLALASALAASIQRKAIELRLFHLMPVVYLAMLMALHVRGTYIFSLRYVSPIVPVTCFLGALLVTYAGLEELSVRELVTPRALVPATLAVAFVLFGLVPYQTGTLRADELLPVATLARFGWTPEDFMSSTVLPALLLALATAGVFFAARVRARVLILLVALMAFFAPALATNLQSTAKHVRAQLGDVTLYPWRAFEPELIEAAPAEVALSRSLRLHYRMGGSAPTRQSLGRVALGLETLRVREIQWLDEGVTYAIGTREDLGEWSRAMPGLAATASFDPAGRIVLVRPREAAPPADEPIDSPPS